MQDYATPQAPVAQAQTDKANADEPKIGITAVNNNKEGIIISRLDGYR